MIKRSFGGILFALALLVAGAAPATAQATKVAYINSQKILAQAPGAGDAEKAFETEMTRYRGEVEQLKTDLEKASADFERQQATLTSAAKQQRQQELQQRFGQYQQRVAELERTAQRRQAELVEPIMRRINEVIEQIRKEGSYAMIFDASAGALITADPALDLTDRVIARLKAPAK